MRMVKGHVHKLAGPWLSEHTDLRDAINSGQEGRHHGVEVSVGCGCGCMRVCVCVCVGVGVGVYVCVCVRARMCVCMGGVGGGRGWQWCAVLRRTWGDRRL